jgi:hypothetical protein
MDRKDETHPPSLHHLRISESSNYEECFPLTDEGSVDNTMGQGVSTEAKRAYM